jgi:hypothetical protein
MQVIEKQDIILVVKSKWTYQFKNDGKPVPDFCTDRHLKRFIGIMGKKYAEYLGKVET